MNKIIQLVLIGVLLSGCSWIPADKNPLRDRSSDYLKSTEIEPVLVPESLDAEAIGQLYPVPKSGQVPEYQLGDKFSVPRVEPNLDQTNTSGVKIQRLSGGSWILVSVSPGEAWPRVRNFLTTNNLPTEVANASTGVIDTAWVELKEDPTLVHQFRLHLEQGVQLNTTEIVIQQRQYPSGAIPRPLPAWNDKGSDDPDQEEWLRLELAQALAVDDITTSASLLGQEIGAAVKVRLQTPVDENPYLLMSLSSERAWASLGYALATSSFKVRATAQDRGVMDFDYYEEKPRDISWFGKLFGKRNPPPEVFYLYMETQGDQQIVRVYHLDGSVPNPRDAYRVLTRIRLHLT